MKGSQLSDRKKGNTILTTGPQIVGGFVVVLLLMIVLAVGAIGINNKLAELVSSIYRHPLAVSNAVRDAKTNIIAMHRDMKDVVLSRSPGELETAITNVTVHEAAVIKSFALISERFLGEQSMVMKALKSFEDWQPIRSEVIELTRDGQYEAATTITKGKGARHVIQMSLLMGDLIDFANNKASQFLAVSNNQRKQSQTFLYGMLGMVLLLGSAIAFVVVIKVRNAEDRILQAMREANFANAAKSDFLSSMSHDLRTPLNAIIGFSEMMVAETFGPLGDHKYREYAKDINISGQLLVNMVNDVLDLSKVEAGQYETENVRINLNEMVTASLYMVDLQTQNKGLKVNIDVPDDLPDLMCDRQIVMDILSNLFSNAVKYSKQNGSIKAHAYQNVDGSIFLSISDTGIGMSEDELANIVEPFYRGNSQHARQEEGTGLGLHICKKKARLIDADMDIKSGSSGTIVTLRFSKDSNVERETELHLVN